MHTSIHLEGANCPTCFIETIEAIAGIDGVQKVNGSFAGPCIEVDHEESVIDKITGTIETHLHGIKMYADEPGMTPVKITTSSETCSHHRESNPIEQNNESEILQ